MRTVLCTSPHVRHPAVLEADFEDRQGLMYSFVPIGLLSLAAVLRSRGDSEVRIFDTNDWINSCEARLSVGFYGSMAEAICAMEPQVLGFMTECDSYHHVLQICKEVRRQRPSIRIVLGGPHASATAVATLRRWSCVDAICVGEGERTIGPLVESLTVMASHRVPGALIRGLRGELLDGGRPMLVEDLDALPIPAFDMYEPKAGEEIFLEVGRGCPFACTFCSTAPYWERRHRVKSPARIAKEIRVVSDLYGQRRFHFTHDLFTTDRRWALAVADQLAALEDPPRWTCSARTDRVDRDLLTRMAAGGCNAIYYGVESGSARVLAAIKKEIPWEVTARAIEDSLSVGIQPNAGLILGFPEDDQDSAKETFEAYTRLLQMGAKPVHIFGFCPFNGAASFDEADMRGAQKHFLDIPLNSAIDQANRELVVADPLLFSAFRRPASDDLKSIASGFVQGVDEFTPLVESCLLPTLLLVDSSLSMFEIYVGWLNWIDERNRTLEKSIDRVYYGGPSDYILYLQGVARELQRGRQDLADFLELALRSQHYAMKDALPISMATFRSIGGSPALVRSHLEEGHHVSARNIVDVFASDWDLSELLNWKSGESYPAPRKNPCGYALQRTHDGGIRVLQVQPAVVELLNALRVRPGGASSIWVESVTASGLLAANGVDGVLDIMTEAAEAGLLTLEEAR